MTPGNQAILKDVCSFIKNNPSLVFMDLSFCKLIEIVCLKLIRACRKAISLQSLHLSGNPGIVNGLVPEMNQTILDRAEKYLNATPVPFPRVIRQYQADLND